MSQTSPLYDVTGRHARFQLSMENTGRGFPDDVCGAAFKEEVTLAKAVQLGSSHCQLVNLRGTTDSSDGVSKGAPTGKCEAIR